MGILFGIEMLVAMTVVKMRFMKVGFMSMQATGWELDFVALAGALTLVFTGAGRLALDPLVGL